MRFTRISKHSRYGENFAVTYHWFWRKRRDKISSIIKEWWIPVGLFISFIATLVFLLTSEVPSDVHRDIEVTAVKSSFSEAMALLDGQVPSDYVELYV